MEIQGVVKKYWLIFLLFFLFLFQFYISRFTIVRLPLSEDSIVTFISVCIGSLSSILGIVVAVLLLGVTLSEQSLGNKMKYILLKDKFIFNYFVVSITSIILFIFVNFIYKGTLNNLIVNLTVYAVILYIISIVLIYPLINISLQKTSSKKHIDSKIAKLSISKKLDYLNSSFDEENEFYVLEEIATNTIKTNDRKMFMYIVEEIRGYLIVNISNADSQKSNSIRGLLNSFVKMQNRWINSVNPSEQEWVAMVLIKTYEKLKVWAIKNDFGPSNFLEYDSSVEGILKKFNGVFQLSELYYIQNVFTEIYRVYLEDMMPDENNTLLNFRNSKNEEKDYSGQLQWHSILFDFPSQYNRIVRINKFNNEEIIRSHVMGFNDILGIILNNNVMSNKQKNILIRNWANNLKRYIGEGVSENMNYTPDFVTYYIFPDFKDKDLEAYCWLLDILSEVILFLPKYNKLNKYIINNFGAIGRMNLNLINESEFAKSLIIKIANIFYQIAKKLENENNLLAYSNYIELYLEIKSFIDFGIKEKNQVNETVLNVWRELLVKLDKREVFEERLKSEENHFEAYFK